ncbi:MAG: HlyD family secretion protein [Marinosulfonomonas sp.]|nr:HlyD family secretion protein [Marinosulfonomonas sp.]
MTTVKKPTKSASGGKKAKNAKVKSLPEPANTPVLEPVAETVAQPAEKLVSETPAKPAKVRSPGPIARFIGSIKKIFRAIIFLVLLAGLSVLAKDWLVGRWAQVSLNDARIAVSLITVSSEVGGRVVSVPVTGGDAIKAGALMVSIDAEKAVLLLQGLHARLTGLAAHQAQLRTQQDMIRTQVASRLAAGRAQLDAAKANHEASVAALRNTQSRFDRVNELAARAITSAQVLESAQTALDTALQKEISANAAIATATANLAVIRSEEARISVLDQQYATLDAERAALMAERAQRQIDLSRREISAAFDGVVDRTFVDPGEYVSPGTRLLLYHNPGEVWVDANVKETEFRKIAIGAPARIKVDAYPGQEFRGEVTRLGGAATSQFALLPSPNPSGNFTKVTQRLPIRVSIEAEGVQLRPGMMVELSIDVTD